MSAQTCSTPGSAGPAAPRALAILRCGAAAVILVAGVYAAGWLVAPVFLALVIVITVHPVRGRLLALGLPAWVATIVPILVLLAALVALALVSVVVVAQLATVLPLYAQEANALVTSGAATLAQLGVGPEQLRVLTASFDVGRLLGLVSVFLLSLTGLIGNLVFLLTLLLFLCIESSSAGARLALITGNRPPIGAAVRGFARGTRRYLGVTTVIGLVTGAVDTVALALLGVPPAALWGLLVFVTNYIPYVGFWIGLAPPALLALLIGGWPLLAAVVAVFFVVNFVLTSLVQPRLIGDAVGLSVSVTLVALVFWNWLLGPLGAVLAVPLTLLAKAVLVDDDPRALWADALLSSTRRVHILKTRSPAPGRSPAEAVPAAEPLSVPRHPDTEG